MIVDCISDLHGSYPKLEGGDLLIVAGDLTARDRPEEFIRFKDWLVRQKYKKIIVIAGNHDGLIEKRVMMSQQEDWNEGPVCYLEDSFTIFEGLKIYGSPWTPEFYNWHFMKKRGEELRAVWDRIPEDTDILVTHGPPYGILDTPAINKDKCGCEELAKAVNRVKPTLHVFGHIHGGYGKETSLWPDGTVVSFVNSSQMDEDYNFHNRPVRIVL